MREHGGGSVRVELEDAVSVHLDPVDAVDALALDCALQARAADPEQGRIVGCVSSVASPSKKPPQLSGFSSHCEARVGHRKAWLYRALTGSGKRNQKSLLGGAARIFRSHSARPTAT